MTEEKLIGAAHHMAEARERVIKEMQSIAEMFASYSERLRTFQEFLEWRDALVLARVELSDHVKTLLDRLVDVLRENTVMLNENSERLEQFMVKMEDYLGSGAGLEHEN
ncbi:MAG: hypothetical protein QOH70_2383 [Blastocatellia bacterium]|jgi:hypothetical protein|nr:hypothetical protein [Blastocatellia bacterium]